MFGQGVVSGNTELLLQWLSRVVSYQLRVLN